MILKFFIIVGLLTPSFQSFCLGGTRVNTDIKSDDFLNRSYQKEYIFLDTERRSVTKQLNHLKELKNKEVTRHTKTIEQLQFKLTQLRLENENLEKRLSDHENSIEQAKNEKSVIDNMLYQARTTLGIEASQKPDTLPADDLKATFQQGFEFLNRAQRLQSRVEGYFLQDGKQVKGDVLSIGQVAAFGLDKDHGGALVPMGEGRLRLWINQKGRGIDNLQNQSGVTRDFYFFESRSSTVRTPKTKTIGDTISAGGLIGWIIVILGVVCAGFVTARLALLKSLGRDQETVIANITQNIPKHLKTPNITAGLRGNCPFKNMTDVAMDSTDLTKEQFDERLSGVLLKESMRVDRHATLIVVIAAVSPLLGLLGTVTGMISTFDIITEFGTGDPKLLSTGISEALVTTMLGLVVAIPAVFFGQVMNGWADKIKSNLEYLALMLSDNIAIKNAADHQQMHKV